MQKRSLLHHYCSLPSFLKDFLKRAESTVQLLHFRFLLQNKIGNMEQIQKRQSNLTLKNMLRLIFHSRFPSVTDKKQHGNSINGLCSERSQRIHGIPLTAVLHIHRRKLPRGKVIPCGKSYRISLVCRNNMPLGNTVFFHQTIAKRLQLRIRNTGKKIRGDSF